MNILTNLTHNKHRTRYIPFVALLVSALLAGCASSGVKNPSGVSVTHMNADEQGFVAGTGVESQDLVMVADKMARTILSIPQIANAKTPPTIVLNPVDNQIGRASCRERV